MHFGTFIVTALVLCELGFRKGIKADKREKRTAVGRYQSCPRGCTRCSRDNGCITCQRGLFLLLAREGMRQIGICTHACPVGYFGVHRQTYSICFKCEVENCSTCFNMRYCTRCTPPYLTYRGQCIEQCSNGLHYANFTRDCRERVDCLVGPWALWTPCMRDGQTCGYKYGMITRTREVLDQPSPNGARCPNLMESRCCRMERRHCADLTHNKSDIPHDKRKNETNKRRRRRRRRKRKRRRRKNKKRKHKRRKHRKKKKGKNRRKKKNSFRKRILFKRKQILRRYKKAWRQFCSDGVVRNDVNRYLTLP